MGVIKFLKSVFINKNRLVCKPNEKLKEFLSVDAFISNKDKMNFLKNIEDYNELIHLYESDNLEKYCSDNNLDFKIYNDYVINLSNFDELIKKHNDNYVKEHLKSDSEYLNNIFSGIDSKIILDEEQRKVVLRDEDYTLVIAGAGAGKTTTVAAKVKYLVDKKKIDLKEILIISFTNKAVGELKERINRDLKIDCPIATFHSTGNAIIRKNNPEKVNIASDSYLYNSVKEFLNTLFATNEELLIKIVLFFSYYLDFDTEIKDIEDIKKLREFRRLETLKSQLDDEVIKEIENRAKRKITIKTEYVRSIEEVKIANFLFMHGIDYEYEYPYPHHIENMRRPYLPDFTIFDGDRIVYLEHFGISEDRKNSMYTKEKHNKYCEEIEKKKRLHKEKGTELIYTFSRYNDGKDLLDDLKEKLIKNGIDLKPRNPIEVYKRLANTKDNRSFIKLTKLLVSFINNFKTNGWDESDFSRLSSSTTSERNKVFLEIAKEAYLYYEAKLKENRLSDFQDLINKSKKILDEVAEMKKILPFKYIIIDEYQDISLQRFNLAKKLSEVTNAKIMAVGDDWQSIYAFAGSKIKLFTEFEQMMGHAERLEITHTYRNSQELIDIAGNFIQKNNEQYKKVLKSPKNINYPVAIFSYSDDVNKNKKKGKSGILVEKAMAVEKALDAIVKRNNKENLEILLIGRYGFDGANLGKTSYFSYVEQNDGKKHIVSNKYPKLDIEFLTAHSSKGLGRDEVIIINAEGGTWGFPSEKTNDPVLNMVIYDDHSYEDAEERRLFYVALTRTKNRVYIIAPKYSPSKFLLEIKEEKGVYKDYDFNETPEKEKRLGTYCPHCGFPIYYKENKGFGEKMYVCTNDPELCGFVSNNLKGGKTSIKKCPSCKSGYLFIKKVRNQDRFFLGCSNYNGNDDGCNHTEELDFEN